MAKHLARIHGTEEDKVNCPFYFKIGCCRHGDRCCRLHHKPAFSPTLLIKHVFRQSLENLGHTGATNGDQQAQQAYFEFYEDLFCECSKFGLVQELHVVDNTGDHMVGHVYVKFANEEMAADALQIMNGRYYDGVAMQVEYSPVTEFREARCRDYDEETCSRAGFCNFIHAKPVPACLIRSLQEDCAAERAAEEEKRRDEKDERRRHKKRKREKKDRDGSGNTGRSSSRKHRRDEHDGNDDPDGSDGGGYSDSN